MAHHQDSPHNESVFQLAKWAYEFAGAAVPKSSSERIIDILIDSAACAFSAAADEKGAGVLKVVRGSGVGGACTVIGTGMRTSLPQAAFANGALIRLLDFNDTYNGPKQIGHPSDILSAALAAAELAKRSGDDLQRAVRLGYEVYGRLLDLTDPETDWDHVSACGISSAVMCGWLLRLSPQQLGNAIALAATHSATLGEVRVGKVSTAKSIASAVVVQTAALVTLLAAEDLTGPPQAIEGRRGYARLLLDGSDFSQFFAPSPRDRLDATGFKPYPCFALGQGPISLAAQLRGRAPLHDIDRVDVFLADTGPARLRLSDSHGRTPESNEAADHSVYVLVALALIDGLVTGSQFATGRWREPDVASLIARIHAQVDPSLTPAKNLPCKIVVTAKGRTYAAECAASPGNPANPLPRAAIVAKFNRCAAGRLGADDQRFIVEAFENLHSLPTLEPLLGKLGQAPHSS